MSHTDTSVVSVTPAGSTFEQPPADAYDPAPVHTSVTFSYVPAGHLCDEHDEYDGWSSRKIVSRTTTVADAAVDHFQIP